MSSEFDLMKDPAFAGQVRDALVAPSLQDPLVIIEPDEQSEEIVLEAEANERIERLRRLGEALAYIEDSSFDLRLGHSTFLVSQFGNIDSVDKLLSHDKESDAKLNLLIARKLLGGRSGLLDMTPEAINKDSNKLYRSGIEVQFQEESKWLHVVAPTVIPGLKYDIETLSFNHSHPELSFMAIVHKVTN